MGKHSNKVQRRTASEQLVVPPAGRHVCFPSAASPSLPGPSPSLTPYIPQGDFHAFLLSMAFHPSIPDGNCFSERMTTELLEIKPKVFSKSIEIVCFSRRPGRGSAFVLIRS